MSSSFILKVKNFWRKNKSKVIIALLIWLLIIVVNYILKNFKPEEKPKTTYEPHTAIMDNSKVPEKLKTPIEELIDKYLNYCNNKEYENAYNMINEKCRNKLYPDIEDFKKYVDSVFDEKKEYYIQNYSNVDNVYIYKVCIFEDILATGLTGSELEYYEEKFSIRNNNGNLELSIREYIAEEELQNVYEDDYIKVSVQNMVQKYETQTYTVKMTNRSEYTIVLADRTENQEILLKLNNENRNIKNLSNKGIVLRPGESRVCELEFTKFYDEAEEVNSIIFNAVRVLKRYASGEGLQDNAIKLYSFELEL